MALSFEPIAGAIGARFRWRRSSLAMWDNRRTQRRVVADGRGEYRRMERVTLVGDVPVA
jgi:alpha-ketoglutarate-dependent taurine dioxygenase